MSHTRTAAAVKMARIITSCRTPAQVKVARTMLTNFEKIHGPNCCLTKYLMEVDTDVTLWHSLLKHRA